MNQLVSELSATKFIIQYLKEILKVFKQKHNIILNFVSSAKPSKGISGGGANLIIKHDNSLTFKPAAYQRV